MARLGAGVGLITLVRFSKKLTLNLSNWISMHTRSLIAKVPNPWNANKDWTLCTCMHLELAAIYVWNLEYLEFFLQMWIFWLAYSLKPPKKNIELQLHQYYLKNNAFLASDHIWNSAKKSETTVLEAKTFVKIFCYKRKCKKYTVFVYIYSVSIYRILRIKCGNYSASA